MKMTRYSEPQILAILRQAEGGLPVSELCREHRMSNASFYKWRSKCGSLFAALSSGVAICPFGVMVLSEVVVLVRAS